jgi:hypothetical protein
MQNTLQHPKATRDSRSSKRKKKKKRIHSYASRHVIIGVIQQPLQCLVKPKSVPVLVLYTAGNALENQMIFRIDTA